MVSPLQQQALDEYLAEIEAYKQYDPERLKAAEVGETALAGLQYDPRMLEYEMAALRSLEEQGREGFTAQDRAALAEAERTAAQAARGRRGAIQQSMQQRGIAGSGLDLVAQLQSDQAANELAAMRALELGGMSAQRRSQGQQAAGQMAGQIGQRQYGQQAERAAAQDRIRAFNAQNRAQAQQFNIGQANQLAANRLQAGQQGAQFKYNVEADRLMRKEMEKERRRRQQAGVASAILGAGGAAIGGLGTGGTPQGAMAGYQIGSGFGNLYQGFQDGGRVRDYNLGLEMPSYTSDTVPAMLTPGEMVLPLEASETPDAAAAYVKGYTKAEQDVEKAKNMRDILGYADIAAKGLSDLAASQAQPIALPGRFEDIGRAPQMLERKMPQYQAGSLSALGEQGVARAKEGLAAAKDKFGMDVGLEKYSKERKKASELEDPNSPVSKNANLLLKSRLSALANEARLANDPENARALQELGRAANMSASQAMQTMQLVENVDYKNALNAIIADKKLTAETLKEGRKETKAQAKDVWNQSIELKNSVDKVSKDNNEIQGRYQAAVELAKTPTGVNDEAILVYFQKILDPGSVVRESEFARTSEGQAALAQAQSYVTKLKTGGMTKDLRKQVLDTMKTLAMASQNNLNAKLKSVRNTAKKYELDEDLIFGGPEKSPLDAIPEGGTVTQDGVRYRKVNGQMIQE